MPRRPLIRTSLYPYHITSRSNNKEWFHISLSSFWILFLKHLEKVCEKYQAEIGSFVLMSNHFHMIIWTPSENIDLVMNVFLRDLSISVNQRAKRINHVFGSRYKWSLIQSERYLRHCYKYVYQNPVRAGLCRKVEHYPYSSLNFSKLRKNFEICLVEDKITKICDLNKNSNERIKWLNDEYGNEEVEVIRLALRRTLFSFPKHERYKKHVKQLI